MDNILLRVKPELKAAIEKILKHANNRFHVIAAENGSELKKIGIGELNSVKLGLYSANKLEIGHAIISNWVSKSNLSENVKYRNGVLFLDVEPEEAEIETNPDDLLDVLRKTDEEILSDDDEFGMWDGLSDDEIENEHDETEL